jgi:predicted neuraminidase
MKYILIAKTEGFIPQNSAFKMCHSPTIVELCRGKLMMAWFGGKTEGDADVCIWYAFYQNNVWSFPEIIAKGIDENGRQIACWNPVLFKAYNGRLFLFYKIGNSPSSWRGMMKYSDNEGLDWSDTQKISEDCIGASKNKPIEIEPNTVLCPSSREITPSYILSEQTFKILINNGLPPNLYYDLLPIKDLKFQSALSFLKRLKQILKDKFFEYRDLIEKNAFVKPKSYVCIEKMTENGQKWELLYSFEAQKEYIAIQPTLLMHQSAIQMLCRSENDYILESWSYDNGKTWSDLQTTDLPNPDSAIDTVKLSNGLFLLIFNSARRCVLSVAISADGTKWKTIFDLENEKTGEFSYPSVIQTADHQIHIAYTWNRTQIKHFILELIAE